MFVGMWMRKTDDNSLICGVAAFVTAAQRPASSVGDRQRQMLALFARFQVSWIIITNPRCDGRCHSIQMWPRFPTFQTNHNQSLPRLFQYNISLNFQKSKNSYTGISRHLRHSRNIRRQKTNIHAPDTKYMVLIHRFLNLVGIQTLRGLVQSDCILLARQNYSTISLLGLRYRFVS